MSKARKIACGIIAWLGFMVMLGTAGESDLGQIDLPQIAIQSAIGLAMFGGGLQFGGWLGEEGAADENSD